MSQGLIIVESPAKIKTIGKYLGAEYKIMASVGHIKDLPKNKLGINLEDGFAPAYEAIEAKKKVISALKKEAGKVVNIYLAPDPDREGEAIAWHIASELQGKGRKLYRVLFNDLSRETIFKAIGSPLELNHDKYEAQQTRRILDRLVGYQISPILWDKVRRGLSAGRVQSVAVRIICDREEEIKAFVPEEYWNLDATLEGGTPPVFDARLIKIESKKAKVINGEQAEEIRRRLEKANFSVKAIQRKEVRKTPPPPFITSKLQQEASRWFRFSPSRTMKIAQKLYEGVELGEEGFVGLITYMRTDSVRIADEALKSVRTLIAEAYGNDYLPAKARYFKNKNAAQDAHEAIRPTTVELRPKDLKSMLTPEQFKLYQLIWNRYVASQMNPAIFDQTVIDIEADNCQFRAQGQVLKFAGFTTLYSEGKEKSDEDEPREASLPQLNEGEKLTLISLKAEQRFTQPPPRFTEAALVKELEEKGIGRPSTYAAILSTIQEREYVRLEEARFIPTELGFLVNQQLMENFSQIMDLTFTAEMEKKLDLIEEGKLNRQETLTEFYRDFSQDVSKAKQVMRNVKKEAVPTGELCTLCESPMVLKMSRWGKFAACSNYPRCKNKKNIATGDSALPQEAQLTDIPCEKCGKPMALKKSRYGEFLGCSEYPTCKHVRPISTGVNCPEPDCSGYLTQKRSRAGRVFYSCSRYPDCKYALWDKPVAGLCPNCNAPFLLEKKKRDGTAQFVCSKKECKYKADEVAKSAVE